MSARLAHAPSTCLANPSEEPRRTPRPAGENAAAFPLALTLLFEAIGLGCLVWAWRAFGMSDRAVRDRFLRTGQLSRTVVRPPSC